MYIYTSKVYFVLFIMSLESSIKFIREFVKGSQKVKINQAKKGGKTKKEFALEIAQDDAFVQKVSKWRDESKINGTNLANHPNEAKLHGEMINLISQRANGVVTVSPGSKAPKMKTMAVDASDIKPSKGKGVDTGTFVKPTKPKQPKWLKDVIEHSIDFYAKPHGVIMDRRPKPFTNWDKDPAKANVQHEIVKGFRDRMNNHEFAYIAGGGAGKGEFEAAQLAIIILNATLVAAGVATAEQQKVVADAKARDAKMGVIVDKIISNMSPEDHATIRRSTFTQPSSSSSSSSTELGTSPGSSSSSSSPQASGTGHIEGAITKGEINASGVFHPEALYNLLQDQRDAAMRALVKRGKENNDETWAMAVRGVDAEMRKYLKSLNTPGNHPDRPSDVNIDDILDDPDWGKGLKTSATFHGTGSQIGQPIPGTATITIPGFGQQGQTSTGAPGSDPDPSQTQEDFERKHNDKETDTKDPENDPTPTKTDEGQPVKKPKRPKIPEVPVVRPDPRQKGKDKPIPPFPDDDTDDDDDDEKKKKPKASVSTRTGKLPELRPFFQVGGENELRPSKERVAKEITDWNLFSYIPGAVTDSADNPLTQHNRRQYNFRMTDTFPDPELFKPRKFTGTAPRAVMRDIYQKEAMHDAHDRSIYRGRGLNSSQRRRYVSGIIDMVDRLNIQPDFAELGGVQQNGVTRFKTSLMLSSKMLF